MVACYITWRADQVLCNSYTLDIYSNYVGSCIFAQDRALGNEARVKEYSRSISALL